LSPQSDARPASDNEQIEFRTLVSGPEEALVPPRPQALDDRSDAELLQDAPSLGGARGHPLRGCRAMHAKVRYLKAPAFCRTPSGAFANWKLLSALVPRHKATNVGSLTAFASNVAVALHPNLWW